MGIVELENEITDIKACAYDLNSEYAKLTQRIEAVVEEMKKLKETSKEETIQIPTPEENKEEVPSTEAAQEITAIVTPIVNNPSEKVVKIPQNDDTKDVVQEAVPGPQELDQTPLSPVGIDITKDETKQVFIKQTVDPAKAILITTVQSKKLKDSKEEQKAKTFGETIESENKPIAEQAVVTPIISENAVAPVDSKQALQQEIATMTAELAQATDEATANKLHEDLKELTKRYEVAS